MEKIEIEKNVPMPNGRRQPKQTYPFAEMVVGDSFAVQVPAGEKVGQFSAKVRTVAHKWGSDNGAKFSVLLVDGQASVRVWRVA